MDHFDPKLLVFWDAMLQIGPMLLSTNSYRTFLSEELARRKTSNPRYSQRAFARQLGLSPGELSELLTGKRKLSLKSALRVARSLGLNHTETKHLVQLIHVEKSEAFGEMSLTEQSLRAEGQQLSLDLFRIVSDWYCFAILNLAECRGFRWDFSWIARRLGISTAEVRVAVERLERVGLVEKKAGKRVVVEDYVMTSSGIPSEAIRNYHRQVLRKAAEALDFQNVDARDISGITIAVDPKNLPAIKKDIQDFQERLIAKYRRGAKTEVYHLENAFFKMTVGDDDVE